MGAMCGGRICGLYVPDNVDSCDSSVLTDIDTVSPFSPTLAQCVAECFFSSRPSPNHTAQIEWEKHSRICGSMDVEIL